MRILKGIIYTCLLTFVSGMANADLILDNVIVITDINGITVSPTTGNITISTVSKNYIVTTGGTEPPPPGTVVINSFTASPYSLLEGQKTLISWTTENADSCTASGGTGDWSGSAIDLPSGSKYITIATAGSHVFTLSCAGNDGPAVAPLTVTASTVEEPDPTTTCSTSPLLGTTTTWDTFWHTSFPNPAYDNQFLTINRTGYAAISFDTGNIVDHGGAITVANTFTNGSRLGSISACPGDFDVADECTHLWGTRGGIGWATDGEPGYCQLEPNTTYYMNFTFTDGFDPGTSDCLVTENCITTVQHINLD